MKSNKELKDAYKQKKHPMGVFQIRNTVNNKLFVGSSLTLDTVWNRIRTELKFNGHRNEDLQKDWNAFGEENFRFEILGEIAEKPGEAANYNANVKELETLFLEELQPFGEKGYNRLRS